MDRIRKEITEDGRVIYTIPLRPEDLHLPGPGQATLWLADPITDEALQEVIIGLLGQVMCFEGCEGHDAQGTWVWDRVRVSARK